MSGYNNFNEVNSNFEEQKCSKQDVNKNSFSLFNQTNLRYDGGTTTIDNEQRLGPGRRELDNMYGCECGLESARDLQLSQPAISFNAGAGYMGEQGCLIDNDSALRSELLTNKNYRNQLPQEYNAGFFGKGAFDVDAESVIQGGNLTSFGDRACNVLSGVSIGNYYTPMIPRLSKEVQNSIHIIPEDNSTGWVRGGVNSRDVFKQLDYKQRCNFKGNNNNNMNNNNNNNMNNNNLNAVN
tara:strand:+ start:2842 stop:3558 length:717 start_codon:yes stop_codon:yes gene_type:complete